MSDWRQEKVILHKQGCSMTEGSKGLGQESPKPGQDLSSQHKVTEHPWDTEVIDSRMRLQDSVDKLSNKEPEN